MFQFSIPRILEHVITHYTIVETKLYRYADERYGKAMKGLKYIFVSPVPMSERGKEFSEEARMVYGKGK